MSGLNPLGTGIVPAAPINGADGLASSLLARATSGGRVDTSALNRELAQLHQTDAGLAARTRGEIEARLDPAQRGELERTREVSGTLADGTAIGFSADGVEQGRWIADLRTSANPAERAIYDRLVQAAGSTDVTAIKGVLDTAYQRGIAPAQIGQTPGGQTPVGQPAEQPSTLGRIANAVDAANPLNRLSDLAQPAVAHIARNAGLGQTEWGGRLQTLLDTPGTAAAFRQGMTQGALEGGKDMVTGVAGIAGRTVQYGMDRSLSGFAGDRLREMTGGMPGWVDAITPSANRADRTQTAVADTAGKIGDYVTSRAGDPALVADDAVRAFDKAWGGLKADHAAAAAKGPEAEARWFGQAMGRGLFEVGSTFVPVAGVVGKVDKAADGLRAVDGLADATRAADAVTDTARTGNRIDDPARLGNEASVAGRTAGRVEGATLVMDANRGARIDLAGVTGRIGETPPVRAENGRLITRDVDGNDVTVRQPRSFDNRTMQTDGSIVYTKGSQSVTYDSRGFPVFGAKADLFLDPRHIKSGDDGAHFRAANQMMREALNANPNIAQQVGLSDAQVRFLTREPSPATAPPGLTWHHHQDTGRIQLVDRAEHFAFPGGHVGGMKLWGGGRD